MPIINHQVLLMKQDPEVTWKEDKGGSIQMLTVASKANFILILEAQLGSILGTTSRILSATDETCQLGPLGLARRHISDNPDDNDGID